MAAQAQAPKAPAPAIALKTPWGAPDLQGIWTDESDTPLQRPPQYAAQEFFTPEQRAELDATRTTILHNDGRSPTGSEDDVATGYNSQFWSFKRTGARTSLIVDPPNGRLPPMTPEALRMVTAERDFRLVLIQATETCKTGGVGCRGGVYDPAPSPRRFDPPPRYNTGRINRNDGPEDSNPPERCLTGGLPEFGSPNGSFRRIVQTAGGISIFYDVGQGQGWQRNIVMDGTPAPARPCPPVVRRLARPLGGQHPRDRCHELQSEDGFPGLARESAPRRALDAERAGHARIRRDRR
jgi:hypothetical protein